MTKDPFRYFRIEARELLDALSEGVLRLEKNPQDAEALASLLRQAHTLKGAARVVKQGELARVAHAFEELLAPVRSGTGPVSRVEADGLFKLLDAGQSALAALDPPGQVKPHHPPPSQKDPAPPTPVEAGAGTAVLDTMRVEVAEVDAILREISEAGGRLNGLRDELHTLRQAQELATAALQPSSLLERAATVRPVLEELRTLLSRSSAKLERSLEGAVRDLSEARNTVHRLRLLPAATVFPALARAVRDAAGLLGKEVDFSTAGGEHRLDAHVLSAVRDAFVHVVRNAVDHGIEPGEARTAAGKPPRGRVVLAVEARGNQRAFICEDDGRGVDAEAVRRAARERGLPPPSDEEAAIRLVLSGGFSTAREATQVSGRGVGLD
ncbi:MAG TPA: Hpt domain-containing protein, partial [Myxococcaceae bacterium]|nr:Hpt domain-containing protein [Myxococcaceae bacterium]